MTFSSDTGNMVYAGIQLEDFFCRFAGFHACYTQRPCIQTQLNQATPTSYIVNSNNYCSRFGSNSVDPMGGLTKGVVA